MVKCSKCGLEVFPGSYVKINNKAVCLGCIRKSKKKKDIIIKCPVCHNKMERGKIGVEIDVTGHLFPSLGAIAHPYWYKSKGLLKEKDIVHFITGQDAFLCKKCNIMTVI